MADRKPTYEELENRIKELECTLMGTNILEKAVENQDNRYNALKEAEEEVRITNQELQIINRIIITSTSILDSKQMLERILDEAIGIVGLEGGSICNVDEDNTLRLIAHRANSDATIIDLSTNAIKVGECLCGNCAKDLCPLILNNREEVLSYSTREATRGEDIRFHAAFPFLIKEKCIGVLCVFTRTDKKPSPRSLKLLETLSAQIAIVIEDAMLFEKAQDEIQQRKLIQKELIEAKERAEEKEARFQLMIANSPDVVIIQDAEGKAIFISPQVKDVIGHDAMTFLGKDMPKEYIHPDDIALCKAALQKLQTGVEVINLEYRFYTADQKEIWVRHTARPIFTDGIISGIQNNISNITLQKELQLELIKSKDLAENLIQTANAIVVSLDLDGKVQIFNNAAERITGYAKDELENKNWFEVLVPKEKYPFVWDEFNRLMAGGMPKTMENPILTKNGDERYIIWQNNEIKENGVVKGVISFGVDITEQKKYQNALKETMEELSAYQLNLQVKNDEFESLNEELSQNVEELNQLNAELNKSKELIEQRESLLNITAELAMVGGWEINLKTQTLSWTNEVFRIHEIDAEFNPTVEKAIGFYDENSIAIIQKAVTDAIEQGKSFDVELGINTAKGNHKYVKAIGNVKRAEDNTIYAVYGVFQDITERKESELERFRLLDIIEKSLNEVYVFDASTLKYVYLNQGALNNIGYSMDEMRQMTPVDIKPQYTEVSFREAISPLLKEEREKLIFKTIHRRKNSTDYLAEVHLQLVKQENKNVFLAVINDITEREQMENVMRESEYFFKETQRAASIGSYKADFGSGRWESSEVLDQIFGIDENYDRSIPGWLNIISPEDREMMGQYLTEEVIGKQRLFDKEYRIIRQSTGEQRWVMGLGQVYLDAQGNVISLLGTIQDITERKKAEEEMLAVKEKAVESERLKTSFLQNISHEIRTPMNAIIGFSDLLREEDISKEDLMSFTNIIQNSSNQLLSIVTDILTISSVETNQEKVHIKPVNVNSLVLELFSIFKKQASDKNISLYSKQQLTDKQSVIYSDKTKLTQILTNLISNALKFTHKGFVEFGYNLKTDQQQLELEFYVKDTGIGIKAELQEVIFERFRQAELALHKKYGGTGLGLSISKAFVKLLGGRIWVESEPDHGSTFYFSIPFHAVDELEERIDITQYKPTLTILIAEDEEYNFLLMEKLLINYHLNILHAKDGQEAVELCKSNSDICLVLMDIKMPIMDGDEASLLIKEFRPDLPIIAQTAYALEHEIARYKDKGFDDFITKPLNRQQLQTTVAKYIENKGNPNEI